MTGSRCDGPSIALQVIRILSALCPQGCPRTVREKFRVIGGSDVVWSILDAHSEDCSLKGYDPDLLDHTTRSGFSPGIGVGRLAELRWRKPLRFRSLRWRITASQRSVVPARIKKRKRDGQNLVRNLSAKFRRNADQKEKRREDKSKRSAREERRGNHADRLDRGEGC